MLFIRYRAALRLLALTAVVAGAHALPGCRAAARHARQGLDEQKIAGLKQALDSVYHRDQQVRRVNFAELAADSVKARAFYTRMRQVDSVNQRLVLPLLDQYGWLPQSLVGEQGARTVYLVVQHADEKTIRRYLPLMEQMAARGEASKTDAATMRDRLLMYSGRKQLYGTQTANWVRSDGTMVVWPIQNPAQVNARRQKLGFPITVEQNAARLGAVYDPREKLPAKAR
ncbi:DUF6624 domain-containing protein [Hymenobacter sp. B81]|uniref:DUF6624 domain-containing protein n=1 Tax=Hymenobacter sp. B81 TaxID=3344878 RepID=UPI0037DC0F19